MKDTSPEVEARFHEMMMQKSGEERLKMGFSMFDMVRMQIAASVKMKKPDADERDIRREIFLRLYGHEFSPKEQEKIQKCIL